MVLSEFRVPGSNSQLLESLQNVALGTLGTPGTLGTAGVQGSHAV
jgi:hypothetical protein